MSGSFAPRILLRQFKGAADDGIVQSRRGDSNLDDVTDSRITRVAFKYLDTRSLLNDLAAFHRDSVASNLALFSQQGGDKHS